MNLSDTTAFNLNGTAAEVLPALGWLAENATEYSVSINTGGPTDRTDILSVLVTIPDSAQALYFKMAWADA